MNFNKWLLLFFMLWFPLQGAAAAVLSVCAQENVRHHPAQVAHDSSEHHSDCHKQHDEKDHQYLLFSMPCDDFSCNAYSHVPIPLSHNATVTINTISLIIFHASGFVSFIPEQPQRPPLIG